MLERYAEDFTSMGLVRRSVSEIQRQPSAGARRDSDLRTREGSARCQSPR